MFKFGGHDFNALLPLIGTTKCQNINQFNIKILKDDILKFDVFVFDWADPRICQKLIQLESQPKREYSH